MKKSFKIFAKIIRIGILMGEELLKAKKTRLSLSMV